MHFHYLVRGICVLNSRVLVAHEIGADNTFLPGGHIENGEKAVDALVREVVEEIGVSPVVRQHIGSIEHTWRSGSEEHHEINLVFQMDLPLLDSAMNPPSQEDHLEFFWVDTADIADHNLLPHPMSELVTGELQRHTAFWASAIGESDD